MSDSDSEATPIAPSKKRKRDPIIVELEVDINAPVPPSKKALRKAKKTKLNPLSPSSPSSTTVGTKSHPPKRKSPAAAAATTTTTATTESTTKRSEYGIWVGNLPWSATKLDVRNFITANTDITDEEITRLHMPSPREGAVNNGSSRPHVPKPQNKGFAYIDFSTASALAQALTLTETLLVGRRVLIKDSKSFEGRPEKAAATKDGDAAVGSYSGKPPSKRIFIGNLGFDTTDEDLREHFARCGQVVNVHVATFEDSGKCKGYGWVEFEELAAGEAAVRGWVDFHEEGDEEDGDEDEEIKNALAGADDGDEDDTPPHEETKPTPSKAQKKKKPTSKKPRKPRKWWVNKLKGRLLKMEFAEDKAVRYKKRYGKDGTANPHHPVSSREVQEGATDPIEAPPTPKQGPPAAPPRASDKNKKGNAVIKRIDARSIKPGAALAAAPRLTGAAVEFKGKKISLVS